MFTDQDLAEYGPELTRGQFQLGRPAIHHMSQIGITSDDLVAALCHNSSYVTGELPSSWGPGECASVQCSYPRSLRIAVRYQRGHDVRSSHLTIEWVVAPEGD